jgi:(E)-4-hydroxy-3-methylbut-2-enyl-diphosphate synthase
VLVDLSKVKISDYKELKAVGHFYLPEPDKWTMNDLGADFIYTGNSPVDFMLPMGLKEIRNYEVWLKSEDKQNKFPYYTTAEFLKEEGIAKVSQIAFVEAYAEDVNATLVAKLKQCKNIVIVLRTKKDHAMATLRAGLFKFIEEGLALPCVLRQDYEDMDIERLQIHASTDLGGLLIDGLGDGVMLGRTMASIQSNEAELSQVKEMNALSFGILQAARTRMSKAEYISCPSCGRTLFDLQETTAMIRKRTDHLKGIKIGIMGCIVNGPGEMADADYGYVGVGKGKIALYRGQEVVKKSVPAESAVDELIELIREDGNWISAVQAELN